MVTPNGTSELLPRVMLEPEPEAARPRWGRRNFLRAMIYAGWGLFAAAGALPALAIKTLQQQKQVVAAGDKLVYAAGSNAGQPLNLSDIQPASVVQAFPANKTDNQDNIIEIVRLPNGGANNGLVAYSAICTHLGCTVQSQLNAQGNIPCPCHGSIYDPAQKAKVVAGPAPRPLPGLPITVGADGAIAAAGGFDGPIGVQ